MVLGAADDGGTHHSPMKTVIVHDWLTVSAGAEVVLEALLEAFPGAEVRTLVYEPGMFRGSLIERSHPRASLIDRLPGARRRHRLLLPLFPMAIEQFDLSGADLVISNAFAVAQGVVTGPDQLHVAYANRTMQYLWENHASELRDYGYAGGARGLVARIGSHYVRAWDQLAWQRPDIVLSNSSYTQRRLLKHYRRESTVMHPPTRVAPGVGIQPPGDYYVTVGRLVPWKNTQALVAAFAGLERPLWIVGDGPESDRLKRQAGPHVRFLGWQHRDNVAQLVAASRGFVTASVSEAFGLAAAEAQLLGVPVVGPANGGLSEIVLPGRTGVLTADASTASIVQGVLDLEELLPTLDRQAIATAASRFGVDRFVADIRRVVDDGMTRLREGTLFGDLHA